MNDPIELKEVWISIQHPYVKIRDIFDSDNCAENETQHIELRNIGYGGKIKDKTAIWICLSIPDMKHSENYIEIQMDDTQLRRLKESIEDKLREHENETGD